MLRMKILLLVPVLALAFAACGGGSGSAETSPGGGTAPTPAPTTGPTPPAPTPLPTAPSGPIVPSIAALQANATVDLGPYQWTDTGGHWNGAQITDYSGLIYAPTLRSMLIFGGGHASTDYDAVNSFSAASLKWQELYLPTPGTLMIPSNYDSVRGAWLQGPSAPYARPAARHTLDEMAVVGDELIVFAHVEGNGMTAGSNWPGGYTSYELVTNARVAHLNLKTLEWTFAPQPPTAINYSAAEYDPPSGKVILLGTQGLFVYDPLLKQNTLAIDFLSFPGANQLQDQAGALLSAEQLLINQNLVFYPPNGMHYYFVSNAAPGRSVGSVFEVQLNRADWAKSLIRRVADAPLAGDGTKFAYDSRNRLIGGGLWQGVFHAFDPVTRSWSSKSVSGPQSIAFMAMDYDPESNAYLLLTPQRRTWAYRWQ